MKSAIERFSDEVLHGMLVEAPDYARTLGITAVGRRLLPTGSLPDFSEAGARRRAAMVTRWASRLQAIPSGDDSKADRLTRRVLEFVLSRGAQFRFIGSEGERHRGHIDPVTHLSGPHVTASAMLARAANVDEALSLLAQLPDALSDARTVLEDRRRQEMVAPREVLLRAQADIRSALAREWPAGGRFGQRRGEASRIVTQEARPAYHALVAELDAHIAVGRDAPGAASRPGGEAYYAWRLESHATRAVDPEAAHATGLREVARLRRALGRAFAAGGLPSNPAAGFPAWLESDSFARHASPGDIEQAVRETLARSSTRLRPLFGHWPSSQVMVARVPPADEASRHSMYLPPAAGEEAGTFMLNRALASGQTRGDIEILCFHEAWPGHHVQLALARELPIPAFRRACLFNAYLEGWAKYAEGLAEENDAGTDPNLRIARLRSELYSTATLVIDTGVHARGWSLDRARRYFCETTGASAAMAEMVALRTAENPGQLAAYKLGLMQFVALRDDFRRMRGARYRVQDFHDAVLCTGALPLDLLEEEVTAIARDQKGSGAAACMPDVSPRSYA